MNILLIFFAIPIATIILSAILETFIRCPIKVAGIFFAIFLVLAFILGGTAELLVAAIVYTIIAFITACIVNIIQGRRDCDCDKDDCRCRRNRCDCDNDSNCRCRRNRWNRNDDDNCRCRRNDCDCDDDDDCRCRRNDCDCEDDCRNRRNGRRWDDDNWEYRNSRRRYNNFGNTETYVTTVLPANTNLIASSNNRFSRRCR